MDIEPKDRVDAMFALRSTCFVALILLWCAPVGAQDIDSLAEDMAKARTWTEMLAHLARESDLAVRDAILSANGWTAPKQALVSNWIDVLVRDRNAAREIVTEWSTDRETIGLALEALGYLRPDKDAALAERVRPWLSVPARSAVALRALGTVATNAEYVEACRRLVSSSRSATRREAIKGLIRCGEAGDLARVVRLLGHDADGQVRIAAAESLNWSVLADEWHEPIAVAMTDAPDRMWCRAARLVLRVDALCALLPERLQESEELRQATVDAWHTHFFSPRAVHVPVLVELLKHEDVRERMRIGVRGYPQASPYGFNTRVRDAVGRALRRALRDELDDEFVITELIDALSRTAPHELAAALSEPPADDTAVFARWLRAVSELGREAATFKRELEPVAKQALLHHSADVQLAGARIAACLGDVDSLIEPTQRCLERGAPLVRAACVRALGVVDRQRSTRAQLVRLARTGDADVRAAAVDALGGFDDNESWSALERLVEDDRPEVTLAVMRALRHISDADTIIELTLPAISLEKPGPLVAAAADALATIDLRGDLWPQVVAAVNHVDPAARVAILRALDRRAEVNARGALTQIAQNRWLLATSRDERILCAVLMLRGQRQDLLAGSVTAEADLEMLGVLIDATEIVRAGWVQITGPPDQPESLVARLKAELIERGRIASDGDAEPVQDLVLAFRRISVVKGLLDSSPQPALRIFAVQCLVKYARW